MDLQNIMKNSNRVHERTDLQYVIVKGRAYFTRAAYLCVITQSTAYPDGRAIYHVESFFGNDAIKIRAEARRYGASICKGARLPIWRDQYIPHNFPRAGLPKPEKEVCVR
jgi:hypothetical protein